MMAFPQLKRHHAPAMTVMALFIACLPAFAGSGGSVYSRFGIGDLRYSSSALFLSMGGTGAAVFSTSAINEVNPAAWSSIGKVRFSVNALYEGFATDDGTSSVYLARTQFDGASLAVPLSTDDGLVLGAGLTPYSRVNYGIITSESQAGLDYTMNRTGDGGISRVYAGLSLNILRDLVAGASFDYYFGTIRYGMDQKFTSTGYSGTALTRTASIKGVGSTLGIVYDGAGNLFGLGEGEFVSVGLSLGTTLYPRIATEDVFVYGAAVSGSSPDTVNAGERKFRLPFSLTGGVSYRTNAFQIAADVRYQKWEGTQIETIPFAQLRNSYRFSAGAELTPGRRPNDIFSRTATYRFGIYHDAGYLRINGESISENGITAGISMPILNETRLSLAAAFALRGTTGNGLQSDRIIRVSASLNVMELWFQRPAEE